jgi:hypothetical protein
MLECLPPVSRLIPKPAVDASDSALQTSQAASPKAFLNLPNEITKLQGNIFQMKKYTLDEMMKVQSNVASLKVAGEFTTMEEKALEECLEQKTDEASTACAVKVTFSLPYETRYGEEIHVVGNVKKLGQWRPRGAVEMRWTDGHIWVTTIEVEFPPPASGKPLEYKYVLMKDGQVKRWEPGENHILSCPRSGSSLVCYNFWGTQNNLLHPDLNAIVNVIPKLPAGVSYNYRKMEEKARRERLRQKTCTVSITFLVSCQTQFGEEVRLVGNVATLGQWDPNGAAAMRWLDGHIWVTTVDVEFPPAESLEYKYVLMSNRGVKSWEVCENHVIRRPPFSFSLVCHSFWSEPNLVVVLNPTASGALTPSRATAMCKEWATAISEVTSISKWPLGKMVLPKYKAGDLDLLELEGSDMALQESTLAGA